MATKKTGIVEFEYQGSTFEAVREELESYETNKQVCMGGPGMYLALERIFGGRDVEYSKIVGGSFNDLTALANAAFAAAGAKAKN